jgi:hypothetical protein
MIRDFRDRLAEIAVYLADGFLVFIGGFADYGALPALAKPFYSLT